jgi:hypothetical protein
MEAGQKYSLTRYLGNILRIKISLQYATIAASSIVAKALDEKRSSQPSTNH